MEPRFVMGGQRNPDEDMGDSWTESSTITVTKDGSKEDKGLVSNEMQNQLYPHYLKKKKKKHPTDRTDFNVVDLVF